MTGEQDFTRVIGRALPYDGPHSRASVVAAAEGVSYLVRYLNNATQPVTAEHTLAWASTIDAVLSRVKAAVYGLDQLFGQLSAAAAAQAETPGLYDASAASAAERHSEGARLARELAEQLSELRQRVVVWDGFRPVAGLAHELDQVHSVSARLGNDPDDE